MVKLLGLKACIDVRLGAYLPKLTISQRRTPKDHLGKKMQRQKCNERRHRRKMGRISLATPEKVFLC